MRFADPSRFAHGTRSRYVTAGCRCPECKRANREYAKARDRARKAGDNNAIVDASPAREHIRKLARAGVGYKMVAASASVAIRRVADIKSGKRRQARAATVRRILAVTIDCRGDAALVSAASTWRRIEKLVEEGYTKRDIAARLYKSQRVPKLQIGRQRVTVRTRARIEYLFEKLTN